VSGWTLNTNTLPSFALPEREPEQAEAVTQEFMEELRKRMEEAQKVENIRFSARLVDANEYAVEFPKIALKGSLADLSNLLFRESEVPIEFGFMTAVTMFGLIACEKLHIAHDPLRTAPNLYTVLVTPTGGKKSSAPIRLRQFFMELEPSLLTHDTNVLDKALCLSSADSGEGLMKAFQPSTVMSDARNRVLLVIDEFETLMNKSRQQNNTLGPILSSLYDTRYAGNTTAKQTKSINNAYLSMLACITTKAWNDLWAEGKERNTGLMNRLFLVSSLPRPKVFQPSALDPNDLAAIKARICSQYASINYKEPLPFTPTAKLMFESFYLELDTAQEEAVRIDNVVKRLALILAATNGKRRIDTDIAEMAIALAVRGGTTFA